MNSTQLLEHFERISEAPDAIPRLRRFILDLAVRGKLVEQDPGDEPAAELLKWIAAEKARLLKAGEIRKPSVLETISEAEAPFALPSTWTWVRVGDIFDYDAGIKRDPKEMVQDLWLLELEDIEKDTSTVLERLRVSDRDSQSTKSEFEVGDILYGKLRPYLNKVVVTDEPGYSTTEIVVIRPFLELCSDYCALSFRRSDFVAYVERLGRGTKMPRLRTPDAIVAAFPLPPLAEQHRIVAKVDELMSLCNQLEAAKAEREQSRDRLVAASLQRLNQPAEDQQAFRKDAHFTFNHLPRITTRPAHIRQLRQTILNLAVRGRLVPQDPNDEPAAELLKRIQTEKARLMKEGMIKKANFVADVVGTRTDVLVPHGWSLTTLRSVCVSITDGDHLPPPKAESGIPFLVIGNVRKQVVDFTGSRFVPLEYYESLDVVRRPRSGDLLYTLVGSYGIPVVVCDNRRFCVQRHIGIIRPSQFMDVAFLARAMESQWIFAQAAACATGIAQKTIPLSSLRQFVVPLPPLAEQHRIVAKVDELMVLCDQLEDQLTTTESDSRRLLESVLHEALAPAPEEAA